ncbi:NAD(P)H-binding protein [Bacillus sp. NP157]|nr:NAD(P)H-binding protein [Bacillus sp. NP157]
MKAFIIGIAGRTGRRLAGRLCEAGVGVNGLARHPGQVEELASNGMTATLGDIADIDADTLAVLLGKADVVVFTAGAADSEPDDAMDRVDRDGVTKTIAAARRVGGMRVFLVSAFPEALRGGDVDPSFERYIRIKKSSEIELAASGLEWVILRASVLLDTPGVGTVSLGFAQCHTQVTRDDVASTLAGLILTPSVSRVILEVTAGDTPVAAAIEWIDGQLRHGRPERSS